MIAEEMKVKLTEQLELWNNFLIDTQKQTNEYTTLIAQIIGRMNGMIDFAYNTKIINDTEKAELYYIYFKEEN